MQFIGITGGNVTNEDRQLFISSVNVVATITDRNNLTVQSGDVAKVTADGKTYIYDGTTWIEISAGTTYTDSDVNTYIKTILTTSGDMLYRNNTNSLQRLSVGADGNFLISVGGVPSWQAITPMLAGMQDVNYTTATSPITEGQVLMWARTEVGNNLPVIWRNRTLQISHITNLQTTLNAKVTNNFSQKGQLLVGNSDTGNAFFTLNRGTTGQTLISTATTIEWNNLSSTNVTEGTNLFYSDTRVNTRLLAVLTTNEDILIRRTGVLSRLGVGGNGQYLTVTGGAVTWGAAPAGATILDDLTDVVITTPVNNNVLRYNGANWINGVLFTDNVTELNSLYFTTARVDSQVNSYFSAKGRLLCGTGASTFSQVSVPASDGHVLVSDITNILTPTGMLWRKLTINDIDLFTVNNPVNGNILAYNGTNWVNSTALTTNTNNIATLSGRVDTLEANILITTINPAVTPYTSTYNQTLAPVIRSTYFGNTAIIPQNTLLQPALNDANFIICGGAYQTAGGSNNGFFAGVANFSQLATRLLQNGPNFSTNCLNGTDFTQQGAAVSRINLNYTNNPITPGAYTLYASSGGFLAGVGCKWWGLKNQAILAAQFAIVNAEPVAGADWDLLSNFTTNLNNGGIGVKVNINTNVNYFLIAITNPGSARISSFGISNAQTVNENYAFGNQLTLSNASGSLVITKNSALQNAEQWSLNSTALLTYYSQTIVCPVIRTSNLIQLTNTQFTDSVIKISNGTNTYSIQNSAGTETYFKVDTANKKVTINYNPWTFITLNDDIVINNLGANNTFIPITLGTPGVTQSNVTNLTFNNANGIMTWNIAGTYRMSVNIQYRGQDPLADVEVLLIDAINVTVIPGGWKRITCTNGINGNINMELITTITLPRQYQFQWRIPAGAPSVIIITSWSVVVTNLFTS